eukprot:m.644458 g.644458  ORF g.644458 m.644458 type:complete len:215 (-) comp58352_c0_seq20:781-1425(-)
MIATEPSTCSVPVACTRRMGEGTLSLSTWLRAARGSVDADTEGAACSEVDALLIGAEAAVGSTSNSAPSSPPICLRRLLRWFQDRENATTSSKKAWPCLSRLSATCTPSSRRRHSVMRARTSVVLLPINKDSTTNEITQKRPARMSSTPPPQPCWNQQGPFRWRLRLPNPLVDCVFSVSLLHFGSKAPCDDPPMSLALRQDARARDRDAGLFEV